MIKNSIGKLYVGITDDPDQRLSEHNTKRGASFTKYRPDFNIAFLEEYNTLEKARQREIQIKKWRRDKKELLIDRYKVGLETRVSQE